MTMDKMDTKIVNLEDRYSIESSGRISFKVRLPEPNHLPVGTTIEVIVDPPVIDNPGAGSNLIATIGVVDEGTWGAAAGMNGHSAVRDDLNVRLTLEKVPPPGDYVVSVVHRPPQDGAEPETLSRECFEVVVRRDLPDIIATQGSLPISLQRGPASVVSRNEWYWVRILAASQAFGFDEFSEYVQQNFEGDPADASQRRTLRGGTRSFERLKELSEDFMMLRSREDGIRKFVVQAAQEAHERLQRAAYPAPGKAPVPENLTLVASRLPPVDGYVCGCLETKPQLINWCPVDLIWAYWIEEAGVVQIMKAIARRFQNRRSGAGIDPLANFEVDPLRPLSNFLWGFIEDEPHQLSVLRRAHEYQHAYGLKLQGRAVADLKAADCRSNFVEAFHNLLYRASQLHLKMDDLTVRPDGYAVLAAIKEIHYMVALGTHNQFADLPTVARREKLVQKWLLARPEMRDFLRGREMVPYPQRWMGPADTMKNIQGWTRTSVVHFHDLAVFGERILLSIRNGSWSVENDPEVATTWARFFRQEVKGYIHAYRAVTGVDLTSDVSHPQQLSERYAMPSDHLRRRLVEQVAAR
jgi:hypothetical protein